MIFSLFNRHAGIGHWTLMSAARQAQRAQSNHMARMPPTLVAGASRSLAGGACSAACAAAAASSSAAAMAVWYPAKS